MDKIQKALNKLASYEKNTVKLVLEKIQRQDFSGLDIKKLKGRDDIFRIRKGSLRIIYQLDKKSILILAIERRSETTYKF